MAVAALGLSKRFESLRRLLKGSAQVKVFLKLGDEGRGKRSPMMRLDLPSLAAQFPFETGASRGFRRDL